MSDDEQKWVRRLVFADADETLLGWLDDLRSGDAVKHAEAANDLLGSLMDSLTTIVQRRHGREGRLSSRFYGHADIVQDICLRLFKAFGSMAENSPEKLPETIEALEGLVRFHIRCAFEDVFRNTFGKNKPGAHHDSIARGAGMSTGLGFPENGLAVDQPGPRTQMLNDELWRKLPEAIAELPEGQREVCEMKYFGGLSNSEISWILGISERTVRDRALKALAAMKRILDSD